MPMDKLVVSRPRGGNYPGLPLPRNRNPIFGLGGKSGPPLPPPGSAPDTGMSGGGLPGPDDKLSLPPSGIPDDSGVAGGVPPGPGGNPPSPADDSIAGGPKGFEGPEKAPPVADMTPMFIEWAFGKAVEMRDSGNEQGGQMIAQGIKMILDGLQSKGNVGNPTLARETIGNVTTNSAAPPPPSSPLRTNRMPFGGGRPVPPMP